jgi:hypothetical protein
VYQKGLMASKLNYTTIRGEESRQDFENVCGNVYGIWPEMRFDTQTRTFLRGFLCLLRTCYRARPQNHYSYDDRPCLAIRATLLLPKSLKRETLVSKTAGNLADVG